MKKLFLLVLGVGLFVACGGNKSNENQTETTNTETEVVIEEVIVEEPVAEQPQSTGHTTKPTAKPTETAPATEAKPTETAPAKQEPEPTTRESTKKGGRR